MMSRLGMMFTSALAFVLAAGAAQAADAFYAGKTITFVVGIAPGGSSDLSCRLLAQYMAKHVAGEPTIVVKNMPSTGGIVAVNYVGKDSKKDGLTAICGPTAPTNQLFNDGSLQVDLTKLNYITGDGEEAMAYVRSDVPPGIKTPDDLLKANGHDLVLTGFSLISGKDISLRTMMQLWGVKNYRYVTGFTGDAAIRAAMEQKFVNVNSESLTSYSQVTVPSLIKTGEATQLWQTGLMDDSGFMGQRDPRYPDVPTLADLYQAKYGRKPSGPDWELTEATEGLNNVAVRVVALPAGSPPEAVAALRAAVEPTNQDAEFGDQLKKLSGSGAHEQPGSVVAKSISNFLNMRPELIDYYNQLVKSGGQIAEKR